MKETFKRTFAAWLLLAVYVPSLLLSSMHVHPQEADAEDDCMLCAHHVNHPPHLHSAESGLHDCALCHFVRLFYTATALPVFVFIRPCRFITHVTPIDSVVRRAVTCASLRAPPFVPCVNCT